VYISGYGKLGLPPERRECRMINKPFAFIDLIIGIIDEIDLHRERAI
jgi:hypothetical protein